MCLEKWDLKWDQLLDLTIMQDYISHLLHVKRSELLLGFDVKTRSFHATKTYSCGSNCNNKVTVPWNKPNNSKRWPDTSTFLKKNKWRHLTLANCCICNTKTVFFPSHCRNCGRCASLFICTSVGNPQSNVWSLSKVNISRYEMLFWLAVSSNLIF